MNMVPTMIQVPMTDFEKKVAESKFPTLEQGVEFVKHELRHDLEFYAKRGFEISPDDLKELLELHLAVLTGSGCSDAPTNPEGAEAHG